VCDTSVLGDFAEEVLTIDRLESTTPEVSEVNAALGELPILSVRCPSDDVFIGPAVAVNEALSDSLSRAWSCDDKGVLVEAEIGAVVEIDGELECKESSERWVCLQHLVNVAKARCGGGLLRQILA
jgi:hypothetical protein